MSVNRFQFVNPYNFIPLEEKQPERGPSSGEEKVFTGVVNYSVRTVTPLFIPNTSNADAFRMGIKDHKSYDFFSYEDLSEDEEGIEDKFSVPVIPGSEMRGLIRSCYEIITNSCLSIVEGKEVLSKRTQEKYKPGLLRRRGDQYEVCSAAMHLMRTMGANCTDDDLDWDERNPENAEKYGRECYIQNAFPEGCRVYFRSERKDTGCTPLALDVNLKPGPGRRTIGYICKGEKGPEMPKDGGGFQKNNKHCCHVFRPLNIGERGYKRPQLVDDITFLDKILNIYKANGNNTYDEYSRNLQAFKNGAGEYFPVFYSRIQDSENPAEWYILLSPACITRDIHKNTLTSVLMNQNSHEPCSNIAQLCPACSLFGTVIKEGEAAIRASSVRFSDLYLKDVPSDLRTLYLDKVTLPALSSPKINNMEFYLRRPTENSWFWTYDYHVDENGNLTIKSGEINGRKFYWHQMIGDRIPSAAADNLNTTVRPLRCKVVFRGQMYFDSITETELNRLIFLLNGGCEGDLENKQHGYKLGMGKPLGLGSIAIAVDSVKLRKLETDAENLTCRLTLDNPYEEYKEPEMTEGVKRNFDTMTNFRQVAGKTVSYPYAENPAINGEAAVYDWFTNNHGGYNRREGRETSMPKGRRDMFFRQYLYAMDDKLWKAYTPERTTPLVGSQIQEGTTREETINPGSHSETTDIFEGTVMGTNEKGNRFVVKLAKTGRVVKVYYRDTYKGDTIKYNQLLQAFPTDTVVTVRYAGKKPGFDGREYDTWRIIG